MHVEPDVSAVQPFIDEGWLSEILYEVKSGKEATVYCCRGGTLPPPGTLLAAKVYRPIETRRFKNDAMYVGGRVHMAREGRAKRAVDSKSAFGREVQYGTWIHHEWEMLRMLHDAGASVPQPIALAPRAILLPFFGTESHAAPLLHEFTPDRATAERVVDELLENIELMLDLNCVHGDLSPFNVIVHEDRPVIIDFPQAVDPRLNRNGNALLARDIANICRWGERHGVIRSDADIGADLWRRFVAGELG